jgi:DNA polymerase-3 subunit gamma/tau
MSLFPESEIPENKPYTVLARKYRPNTLDGLIGQEALVRTLRNAMQTGRLAHAFLLTGIRGVGKTTTARIIARALNNIPDNQPVDGHIDVVEMDAASNTGVDNVREIIEAAKYKPLSAPYKIYIIDEVHMLSKGAFNALLKTLEEPPAHVKFIFATTEIRKIPVTILSRCQRFDLRRVEVDVLSEHLKRIAAAENVEIEDGAIRLIANAAEGSVRDSLSLLDQSIAYAQGKVTLSQTLEMLGYADKTQIIALFELILSGQIAEGLNLLSNIFQTSAEPSQIVQDLLDFCHLVTRLKITPDLRPTNVTESELAKALELSGKLSLQTLSRVWQMLLKAHNELRFSPNQKHTIEMAIIRLAYASDLPDPSDLIKDIKKGNYQSSSPLNNAPASSNEFAPVSFSELVDEFRKRRELITHSNLKTDIHLVSFKQEKLEIRLRPEAPKDLPNKLTNCLNAWTGKRWMVIVSSEQGEPTLAEQEAQTKAKLLEDAQNNPVVKEILEQFTGSVIKEVKINTIRELRNGHSANHETGAANAREDASHSGKASS